MWFRWRRPYHPGQRSDPRRLQFGFQRGLLVPPRVIEILPFQLPTTRSYSGGRFHDDQDRAKDHQEGEHMLLTGAGVLKLLRERASGRAVNG